MATMRNNPFFTTLVLLLALLTTALATPLTGLRQNTVQILARQTTGGNGPATVDNGAPLDMASACAQYSRIANMSAVGGNATYRLVYIAQSPVGTLFDTAMLNQAVTELPALTMDVALNQACGNLTTIALEQAALNYTMGIVAQFVKQPTDGAVINGPIIIFITIFCLVVLLGPATAL